MPTTAQGAGMGRQLPPPPAPLPPIGTRNLQLSQLCNQFAMQVGLLLDLPKSPMAAKTQLTHHFTTLSQDATFGATASTYANHTFFAALLQNLNTLSVRASHALYRETDTPTPATPATTNAAEPPAPTESTAPYLRAVRQPPRRVNRLPPLPPPDTEEETTTGAPQPPLSTRGINRALRTATRMVGHERHKAARIKTSSPLRGPQHFRNALREGGLLQPVVVVPTDDACTFFLIGQPSHLARVQDAYARYVSIIRARMPNMPTIEVSELGDLHWFASTIPEHEEMYRQVSNERLRLDSTTFGAKRFFMQTLLDEASSIIRKLSTLNSQHPMIRRHADTLAILNQTSAQTEQQTGPQPQQEQTQRAPQVQAQKPATVSDDGDNYMEEEELNNAADSRNANTTNNQ